MEKAKREEQQYIKREAAKQRRMVKESAGRMINGSRGSMDSFPLSNNDMIFSSS